MRISVKNCVDSYIFHLILILMHPPYWLCVLNCHNQYSPLTRHFGEGPFTQNLSSQLFKICYRFITFLHLVIPGYSSRYCVHHSKTSFFVLCFMFWILCMCNVSLFPMVVSLVLPQFNLQDLNNKISKYQKFDFFAPD